MNKVDLASRLRTVFQAELEEQLRVMNADLLALEKAPGDAERLKSLFRVAHTLKGAAAASEVPLIADVCHELETMLSGARDGTLTLGKTQFDVLFAAADAMEEGSRILREGGDLSNSALSALSRDLERGIGSAAVRLSQVDRASRGMRQSGPQPRLPAASLGESRSTEDFPDRRHHGGHVRLESDKLDSIQSAVERLSIAVGDVLKCLADARAPGASAGIGIEARALSSALRELEESMRVAQLRPFAEACDALARVVRDVSAEAGKDVALEIAGGDVEAERAVVDGLREALLHLVRNAVDHGIEAHDARLAAGKPAQATIRISATLRGDRITVAVSDDGAGLDMPAVRARLAELGRRVPADDREAAVMLFEGGVSTRSEATAISGRGVGLNLVKDAVARVHGTVSVDWVEGRGTTFTMESPLALASIRALIVGIGPQRFAIPTANVSRIRLARPDSIRSAEGRSVLTAEDGTAPPVPVVSLARLLGPPLAERPMAARAPTVILSAAAGSLAAVVDEVLGEQQITIRRLDGRGADLAHFMGAAVLPGGRIALAINAPALVAVGRARTGMGLSAHADPSESRRPRVLVVDDSITTRTLEQSVLEAGGYETITAVDGAAAWQLLNEEAVDLVVADVEMPRMDGFALCEAIRSSRKLMAIPVVLVTALEKPEDRARGLEAGADAYIGKSSFDQKTLLDTVERMLG